MDLRPGDRVGLIRGLVPEKSIVKFLGYGTYLGQEVPPEDIPGSSQFPQHKFMLDSGEIAWGFEVWWSSEDEMKNRILGFEDSGWNIQLVQIGAERALHKGREGYEASTEA